MMNAEGRPSGEAFIEVEDDDDAELAAQKDNQMMGQRYIEGEKKKKLILT